MRARGTCVELRVIAPDHDSPGEWNLHEVLGSGRRPEDLKGTDPATGARTWYFVEYRQAIGFDGFLANNTNVVNRAVIYTVSESSLNSSYCSTPRCSPPPETANFYKQCASSTPTHAIENAELRDVLSFRIEFVTLFTMTIGRPISVSSSL